MAIAPGPKGLRILQTILSLRKDFLAGLGALQKEFGDVVRVRLPGREFVFIFHPEAAKRVTKENQRNYVKNQEAYHEFFPLTGNGLVLISGEQWAKMRRIVIGEFAATKIRNHFDLIVRNTQTTLAAWNIPKDQKKLLDIYPEMHRLALLCAGEALFGEKLEQEVFEIGEVTGFYTAYVQDRLSNPLKLPRWVPTAKNKKAKASVQRMNEIISAMIERHRHSKSTNVMSNLLNFTGTSGEKLTDTEIRDQVITLLLAAHETTANLLCWTLYLLAQNKDWLQELREEQKRIVGNGPLKPEHIDQFRFLEATLRESTRIFPPAPLISRTAVGSDELGGFEVSPKSVVLYPFYHTQRDERFWKEPFRFNPRRFMEETAETITPFAYFAFGRGGVRSCPGEEMALFETRIILSEIIRHLSFELDPSHQLKTMVAVNLRPINGLPMFLQQL